MAQYTAPLRDIQFVLHELLDVGGTLKDLPAQAEPFMVVRQPHALPKAQQKEHDNDTAGP